MATTTAKKTITQKTGETAFSVIMTGGKQYIVHEHDTISVEKMDGEFKAGDVIVFDQVLMTYDGSSVKIGEPVVTNAKVSAEFVEEGRGKKITVIRYKAKSRYSRKTDTANLS
jgi:large subunit ribosomal protein L21